MLEIEVLTWDMHNKVEALNRLMDSKPSSLDYLICNDNTYAYTYDKKPAHYVLQTTGTDTSMNKLDHSLVDTCSILKEVNEERADCLKKFIKCKPLVKWIKEAMPCKFMNKLQMVFL